MLVVEGLTCRFGTKAAVDNASFSIAPGGFIGVIGRSGAGKSTLLRTINRLAPATSGRILFNDMDVTALKGQRLRRWRARSRHDLPAVQPGRPPRRADQCADGPAVRNPGLALAGPALA